MAKPYLVEVTEARSGGYRVWDTSRCPLGEIYKSKQGLYTFLPRERYGSLSEEILEALVRCLRSLNGPLEKRAARIQAKHASVERVGEHYVHTEDQSCPFD